MKSKNYVRVLDRCTKTWNGNFDTHNECMDAIRKKLGMENLLIGGFLEVGGYLQSCEDFNILTTEEVESIMSVFSEKLKNALSVKL